MQITSLCLQEEEAAARRAAEEEEARQARAQEAEERERAREAEHAQQEQQQAREGMARMVEVCAGGICIEWVLTGGRNYGFSAACEDVFKKQLLKAFKRDAETAFMSHR